MSQHVHSVCRTGYYHLRNIWRIRRYLTQDATKTLVHALVTSILDYYLDYYNSLLYGLPTNLLAKMQRLQNACARVITRTGRRSHITPVLKELHWLPVHRRIEYNILSHTYRAINHQSPVYLSDLLSVYRPTRSPRSESTINQNGNIWRQNFYESSGDAMEQFAPNIRNSDTCIKFQWQLKTFLFRQQYIDNK